MAVASVVRIVVASVVALTVSSVGAAPTRFAPEFNCFASLPAPHPSGGMIKAHMRISCKRQVAAAYVEVHLWRLRSWGWEEIGKRGRYDRAKPVRTADTFARAAAASDECYYYRSTGKGHIINWQGEQLDAPGEGVNYDQRYLNHLPPGCGTNW